MQVAGIIRSNVHASIRSLRQFQRLSKSSVSAHRLCLIGSGHVSSACSCGLQKQILKKRKPTEPITSLKYPLTAAVGFETKTKILKCGQGVYGQISGFETETFKISQRLSQPV